MSDTEARHGRAIAGEARPGDEPSRDAQVFAANLRRLTLMAGLTWRRAAERVGATHVWYRRAVTRGLTRITGQTRPVLERVVAEFRLARVEDLWEPGLVRFERAEGLPDGADAHLNLVWRQREWWPWARKLAHVLASGQHPWVKELIDTLYKVVPHDVIREPEPGASFWSSDADGESNFFRDEEEPTHDRLDGRGGKRRGRAVRRPT